MFPILFALVSAVPFAAASAAGPRREPLPGQIIIDPQHPEWLKRHGGGHVFICGPGDPEGFLYRGERQPDGTRAGDQIESIDKLIRHGGNCIYMQMVRTHGGDAKQDTTHNPFVDSNPARGLDARILAQWEEWFARMDRHGILIYLFFYDDGARIWDTGERVGAEEQAFFEAIVRRFRHHRNLIWVVGEESEERYAHARVNALAEIIRRNDHPGRVIGNHHLRGTTFKAWQPGSALNHYSMQYNVTGEDVHAGAIEARRVAAGRYQVIYAENTATPPDVDSWRAQAWSVAMGGVMPMLLQMDIAATPPVALAQCRHLQRFFEAADFQRLRPHDDLAYAETKYVLADPGRSYIAYADKLTEALGLEGLPAGRCEVAWLDCRTGATATAQLAFARPGRQLFRKPAGFGPEGAAWIRFPEIAPAGRAARVPQNPGASRASAARGNEPPVVAAQRVTTRAGTEVYIQLGFTDDDGPGPYAYTIVRGPRHGTLSGDNNDLTYTPAVGFVGEDEFTWKVNDGVADSPAATVTIGVRN